MGRRGRGGGGWGVSRFRLLNPVQHVWHRLYTRMYTSQSSPANHFVAACICYEPRHLLQGGGHAPCGVDAPQDKQSWIVSLEIRSLFMWVSWTRIGHLLCPGGLPLYTFKTQPPTHTHTHTLENTKKKKKRRRKTHHSKSNRSSMALNHYKSPRR